MGRKKDSSSEETVYDMKMAILFLITFTITVAFVALIAVLHQKMTFYQWQYASIATEVERNSAERAPHLLIQIPSEGSSTQQDNEASVDLIMNLLKNIQSNPYNLTTGEIVLQFETANVKGLKSRVKRFACWHSCFGQFRKKTYRKPYNPKPANSEPPKPYLPSDDPVKNANEAIKTDETQSESDTDAQDTNQLGDGDEKESEGKRRKKSPNPSEYYKTQPNPKTTTSAKPSKSTSTTKSNLKQTLKVEKTVVAVKTVATDKKAHDVGVNPSVEEEAESESAESGEDDDAEGSESNEVEEASESEESVDDADGVDKENVEDSDKKK